MALAILDLLAFDDANVRFSIDTGTNKYYQLKAGKSVQRSNGIDWVDEIFLTTRMATNEPGRSLFNSSKEIAIPATRLGAGKAYVQLFSYKTPDRKSPAFSRVITVPVGSSRTYGDPDDLIPLSLSTSMNTLESFRPPRMVSCRTCQDVYSQPASLEDLLAGIVRVASPVVMNLLSGAGGGGGATTGTASSTTSGASGGQAESIVRLLTTLLGSLGGPAVSRPSSLLVDGAPGNRFFGPHSPFAQPFIFGIDDAILGAFAGQIVQVLPQLMTAANQKRVDMKRADNKLITDILSDVNRRLMMSQLLEAQRQQPPAGADNSAQLTQLLQLLQQTGSTPPADTTTNTATANPPTNIAGAHSLSTDNAVLSSKAVIEFVFGAPISWNGGPKVLFARGQDLQLQVQLKTAVPPKSPLPKAIVKIILRDAADPSVQYEKVFKQKDLYLNTPTAFSFTQGELAQWPANKTIAVLAEMRWLTKGGTEFKALGSSEIVLVNKYFYKDPGGEAGEEKELTDIKRFRPFWNKVWESPALDVARGGEKKYLWELNINAKYTALLSAANANGLMQTKLLRGKQDPESLSETIEGRMKAGIELSVSELNKLLPMWNGEVALEQQKLEALQSSDFLKNNSGEFVYNFKLKGRAGERGMVWVIPVFKLFECTLSAIDKTSEGGQVLTTSDEKIHFPLPTSARVIGLKTQN